MALATGGAHRPAASAVPLTGQKPAARLFVIIGRKRHVLLETEFQEDAHHHTQRALANLTEQLANHLKVSWSQS